MKTIRTCLLILILTPSSQVVHVLGQGRPRIDSLIEVLASAKEDTTLINTINILVIEYRNHGDYEKAMQYASDALERSQKAKYLRGEAKACNNMANIFVCQGNNAAALKNYVSSLEINKKTGDKKGIAYSYNNIGNIQEDQGSYPEALKSYLASLRIFEETADKSGIAGSYNNIGNVYADQGNYAEALKSQISSLKIRLETGNKRAIAVSYSNIGNIHAALGNYREALKNYHESLKIACETGIKQEMAEAENQIGSIHKKMKRYGEAKKYLGDAIRLAAETGNKKTIIDAYRNLAALDSATGSWKSAYLHTKKYMLYRDSLFSKENVRKTVLTKMQYKFERKEAITSAEQEKKDLWQRNIRIYFILLIVFILVFSAGLWSRLRFVSWSKKQLQLEKDRSENLLLNILPEEIAPELKEKGRAEARDYEQISVLAAREMQSFMTRRKQERDQAGLFAFEMRLGIHTGPVVAGIVGLKKFQYDIWGDTVNTASRMESSGEKGKVNISRTTYEFLKDDPGLLFTPRGMIRAKNKEELSMYFVGASRADQPAQEARPPEPNITV